MVYIVAWCKACGRVVQLNVMDFGEWLRGSRACGRVVRQHSQHVSWCCCVLVVRGGSMRVVGKKENEHCKQQ
eukprot:5574732-Lingulodinium_polyedra.AAC.1